MRQGSANGRPPLPWWASILIFLAGVFVFGVGVSMILQVQGFYKPSSTDGALGALVPLAYLAGGVLVLLLPTFNIVAVGGKNWVVLQRVNEAKKLSVQADDKAVQALKLLEVGGSGLTAEPRLNESLPERRAGLALWRVGSTREMAADAKNGERVRTMSEATADPNRGKFGGTPERNGRLLSAKARGITDVICEVELEVTSIDASRPLDGFVKFYLHPTFVEPEHKVPVRGGKALLTIRAWGTFTVGAEVLADGTRLELNLSDVPGGNPAFYQN